MTDADIRRWLSHQTSQSVGHIPFNVVAAGATAIKANVDAQSDRFLIADAVTDQDLIALGAALKDAPLITGGSGIAIGLPRNVLGARNGKDTVGAYEGVGGPEAILVGSCSGATRNQIDVHARNHPTLAIDVPGVMAGTVTPHTLVEFYQSHEGRAPLAYSSGTPDDVCAMQDRYGRDAVAHTLDNLFADTAQALIKAGYRKLVVAGGETSGAVAQAVADSLGSPAMTIGPEIDPGVPVLSVGQDAKIALALKSGNFGAEDFFDKALDVMGAGA